jgi:hypothetical protein
MVVFGVNLGFNVSQEGKLLYFEENIGNNKHACTT